MRSKLFVNPDGTAKMQQIRIEAHGKDGATGIKAVSRLANMVNSLKACKTPQEEIKAERYAKINCCNFCKGSRLHTCTGYDCRLPYRAAYEFAITHIELL